MNILGLGNIGCSIAKQFAKYKQFSVHLVDTESQGGSCSVLPEYTKAEDYEKKYVNLPFELEDDLTLILCGDELMCCSSLRILEQYKNLESVLDKTVESPATYSIKTFGVMDLQSGEEKFFYPLDEIREKRYSYYISKTKLDSDVDLSDHIEYQIGSKFKENLKVSFAVYESPLEQSSVYIEVKSPYVQG